MTMIERVTQAIYDALEGPVNNQDFKRQLARWELSKLAARAAIEAMRDPTDRIINAVETMAEERYRAAPEMQRWYGDDVWNAGIDAALSEGSP